MKFLIPIILVATLLPAFGESSQLFKGNPFLPPGYRDPSEESGKPPPVAEKPPSIQFKGIFELGTEKTFILYDNNEKKSYFLKENASIESTQFVGFDAGSMQLTINQAGRALTLDLVEASNTPSKIQPSSPNKQAPPLSKPASTSEEIREALRKRLRENASRKRVRKKADNESKSRAGRIVPPKPN